MTTRILKTWEDAHTCDACRMRGETTITTHSTTDMREVTPGVFEETKRVRYGCTEHPVVAMAFLLSGNYVTWEEACQLMPKS